MLIGVPKEIKTKESRVSVVPRTVKKLTQAGHTVLVEKNAGILSGIPDALYIYAGAQIAANADEVWGKAELIVKVKEPLESEYHSFRSDQVIFTFLHLAAEPKLAKELCRTKVLSISYDTVELENGELPILAPMSEVAGRAATQVGAALLHAPNGGKGLLLGGVTGTKKGTVVVIGGGHAGLNAAEAAMGLGAETIVLDIKDHKLQRIEERYGGKIKAVKSTPESISEWVAKADLLVGAVLVAGDRAPHVVSRKHLASMEDGSVIVDIAIDQGGCLETSRVTSHDHPTYVEEGIIHYCVPNMPALAPRTSTEALTAATEPYLLQLANEGIEQALAKNASLGRGLQTRNGKVVLPVLQKLFPELA